MLAKNASFSNFFKWIKAYGTEAQWPYVGRTDQSDEIIRNLFCDLDQDFFFGVFLSARNTDFQHFLKREGDKITVERKSTNGNPPIDMNFFCMRLDSNKGIFSHYVGSYAFTLFIHDLWMSYKYFVSLERKKHTEAPNGESQDKIDKQYSLHRRKKCGPLFTPGDFNDLVGRLSSISEVRATTYAAEADDDSAVSSKIQSIHKIYRLEETPIDGTIIQWFKNIRNKTGRPSKAGKNRYSGSILGSEKDGKPLLISFENTMEDYLDCNYDDIDTFDVGSIKEHALIKNMIERLNDRILFN